MNMDNIQRWLKSLRLHKYQPLFKTLTYEEMLNLDEAFLVDKQVTKGARNKILVSVRKLNMRQDKLIHLVDDINQGNISMKEALTALSEMLITPIPQPSSPSSLSSASSSTSGFCSDSDAISVSSMGSLTSTTSNDPHHLTYLFVDTFEKVAQQLIELADYYEDAACHGIMATIVDECLKHNSFTKEQKARVARFRQQPHINRQYHRHPVQRRQLPQPLIRQCHWQPFQQRRQQQPPYQQQQQQHQLQQQQLLQQQQSQSFTPQYHWHSVKQQQQQQHQQQPPPPPSNQYPYHRHQQSSNYKEYSLLSPCLTFELPCLRARISGSS